MRRRRLVLGALLALAIPAGIAVKSCGFSARIDVILRTWDRAEYVTFARCGASGQNTVDLVYSLLSGAGDPITEKDPLLAGQGRTGVAVDVPEPFDISNRAEKVTANVVATSFVDITPPNPDGSARPRGVALVMDNSCSFDGRDETANCSRGPPPTDPNDDRISGARNFVTNDLCVPGRETCVHAPPFDRMTLIAFHGSVDARLRRSDTEAPSSTWFTANASVLTAKLDELRTDEKGKTPLYDAIVLGARALRALPSSLRPVMVLLADGPDNASNPATFDDAKAALLSGGAPIPVFAIGVGTLLGEAEDRLRELACSTEPNGVYVKVVQPRELGEQNGKFERLRHLLRGYWKSTLNLTIPQGLPAGTYTVSGKVFAEPMGPRCGQGCAAGTTCDTERQRCLRSCDDNTPCGEGMQCDTGRGRCFMRASFTISVP